MVIRWNKAVRVGPRCVYCQHTITSRRALLLRLRMWQTFLANRDGENTYVLRSGPIAHMDVAHTFPEATCHRHITSRLGVRVLGAGLGGTPNRRLRSTVI
jgi:hypothetical protein